MGIRFILLGCANVFGSAWYFLQTSQIRAVVDEKLTQGPILRRRCRLSVFGYRALKSLSFRERSWTLPAILTASARQPSSFSS